MPFEWLPYESNLHAHGWHGWRNKWISLTWFSHWDHFVSLGVLGFAIEWFVSLPGAPGDFSLGSCCVCPTGHDRRKVQDVVLADSLVFWIIPGEINCVWQKILGETSNGDISISCAVPRWDEWKKRRGPWGFWERRKREGWRILKMLQVQLGLSAWKEVSLAWLRKEEEVNKYLCRLSLS